MQICCQYEVAIVILTSTYGYNGNDFSNAVMFLCQARRCSEWHCSHRLLMGQIRRNPL